MAKQAEKQISASLEDYLEAIYCIIEEKNGVKAIEISRRLGVGRSSVTEALKTLAEKKLVNYGRYDIISLTPQGKKAAQEVIFRHKILNDFFVRVLGLSPKSADTEACKVEHVVSEETIQHFISFMEYHKQFINQNENYIEKFLAFHKEFHHR